jgi:hypothetical protein
MENGHVRWIPFIESGFVWRNTLEKNRGAGDVKLHVRWRPFAGDVCAGKSREMMKRFIEKFRK